MGLREVLRDSRSRYNCVAIEVNVYKYVDDVAWMKGGG